MNPLCDAQLFRFDDSGHSPAFFSVAPAAVATADLVVALREAATRLRVPTLRVCLHDSREATLQDMIVLVNEGAFCRPHRHPTRDESYHAVDGAADLLLFADAGQITRTVRLEPGSQPGARLPANLFHVLIPRGLQFIYREFRAGPFRPTDSEFPPWAPDGSDGSEAAGYMAALRERAGRGLP